MQSKLFWILAATERGTEIGIPQCIKWCIGLSCSVESSPSNLTCRHWQLREKLLVCKKLWLLNSAALTLLKVSPLIINLTITIMPPKKITLIFSLDCENNEYKPKERYFNFIFLADYWCFLHKMGISTSISTMLRMMEVC